MRKLIVAAMVAAATGGLLTAGPAQADTVCVPITVDGQPIYCLDTSPLDPVVGQVESTVSPYTSAPGSCRRDPSTSNGVELFIPVRYVWVGRDYDRFDCYGYELSVTSDLGGVTPQNVHVPQVCITTTGTCVGPVDEVVNLPSGNVATVCLQAVDWRWNLTADSWSEDPWSDEPSPGCGTVPIP